MPGKPETSESSSDENERMLAAGLSVESGAQTGLEAAQSAQIDGSLLETLDEKVRKMDATCTKTVLDLPHSGIEAELSKAASLETLDEKVRKMDATCANTVLDLQHSGIELDVASENSDNVQQVPPGLLPPPPPPKRDLFQGKLDEIVKNIDATCIKTVMDLQQLGAVVQSSNLKKAEKMQELKESESGEAPKPLQPIENYRTAAPCKANWEEMSGPDNFKICHQCGLHAYNFNKMEMAQVNTLVYKREAKEKPAFYRRQDGTFMTSNCPIGLARVRKIMFAATGGLIALGTFIVVLVMAPKPASNSISDIPAPMISESETAGTTVSNAAGNTGNNGNDNASANSSKNSNAPKDSGDFLNFGDKGRGIVTNLPNEPNKADMPPAPNSKSYPSSHNPLENKIVHLKEMPEFAHLPQFSSPGAKFEDGDYHPALPGGRACYQKRVSIKEDSATVLKWYRSSLEQGGWQIEKNQNSAVTIAARRPEDGTIAFVHTIPSSGKKGYQCQYVLRYMVIPKKH